MLISGSRGKILPAVIVAVFIVSFFLNCQISEATQRSSSLNELMKKSLIRNRQVEINGKIYYVFVNQAEKSITVRGEVGGWEEKDQVEQYLRLRIPSDYHINYDLSIIY